MSSGARLRSATSRAGWASLVLAVLAGVFAMHALSPAGMPATGEHAAMTSLAASGHDSGAMSSSAAARRDAGPVSSLVAAGHDAGPVRQWAGGDRAASHPGRACRQPSDATDGGGAAMTHAGGTCAAAGTSASYAPPALLPAPGLVPNAPPVARTGPAAEPAGGRAPPDLAELQLLRI